MLYLPLLLAISTAKDLPNCVGAAHCDPGDTCCQDVSRAIFYGCCSASSPVCCSDHEHCCTLDYPICDPGVGGCVNAEGELGMSFGVRGGAKPGFLRVTTRGAMMAPSTVTLRTATAQDEKEIIVAAEDEVNVVGVE